MCLIYSVFNPNNIKKYGNILINIISLFYMYVCLYVLGSKTTPTKNSPSRCVNCSFYSHPLVTHVTITLTVSIFLFSKS